MTTNLRPGYVRKNGAPYSEKATVTEYWDLNELPNGDRWLTVITKVEDPRYFTRTYTTSSDFKKLPTRPAGIPRPAPRDNPSPLILREKDRSRPLEPGTAQSRIPAECGVVVGAPQILLAQLTSRRAVAASLISHGRKVLDGSQDGEPDRGRLVVGGEHGTRDHALSRRSGQTQGMRALGVSA